MRLGSYQIGAGVPEAWTARLGSDTLRGQMIAPGAIVSDRFEILGEAARGGMGAVFRARDRRSGQTVALKVMLPGRAGEADRFQREADLLADLDHPAIVRYLDRGHEGDLHYLAMQWVQGAPLSDVLGQGPLGIARSVRLARRLAHALASVHARGVVHRDLKPANLLLPGGDVDEVVLVDFGIARARLSSPGETVFGQILGTPGYMAPEQARGELDIDPRADVFALGVVLFECITGQKGFTGTHPVAVLVSLVLDELPRPREIVPAVPEWLDELVARMVRKDPGDRPADGAAVGELLARGQRAREPTPSPIPLPLVSVPAALGRGEQRLLTALLARAPDDAQPADETIRTAPPERGEELLGVIRDAVLDYGARVDPLADGSLVVTLFGSGVATDQAARAGRMALTVKGILRGWSVSIATGRGDLSGRRPAGEAIERAAALLGDPRALRIDDDTAGLLEARFEVVTGPGGAELRAERESPDVRRTLLGRPTLCVGRERELTSLAGAFEACVQGPCARAALITGPAGVGKSRLRSELVRAVAGRAEILVARGDALRTSTPFAMIGGAVRIACAIRDEDDAETRRAALLSRVARRVPAADAARVAEFLGEISGTAFDDDASVPLRAARRDPSLMGQQIRRALCDWLRHECATRPLMLVLEDLHWGDAPTVVAIDEVLGQLEDQPLFVLALGRPELSDRFADLWLDRDVEHVVVGGLPPRASARLIRSVLGDEVPESTVRRLVQHAAGNAFFLEELIRGEARGLGETAPGTVLAMVQARLEALSAGARRLLRAGSIFGRVFSSRGVAALVGVESDAEELEACLRELWEREVLSHRKLGAGTHDEEHSFRHDLVREAAYGMLTDADRVLGHQLAADWLIAEGQTDAAALAAHFELGGRPDDAVAWVCVAARQALEGNDLQAALAFVRAGERCGAAGDRLGVLRFVEAQVLTARGELSEARARAVSSVGLFERGSTPWFDALGEVSVVSGRLGDWPLALDVARALLEHEEVPADARVAAAIAAARTTGTALFVGRMDLADGLLERAERWAGVAGRADPTIAAHLELTRCLRSFSADHPLQSVWHAEAARRHFEATGNVRGAAVMQVNLGLGLTELGDSSRAEAVLRQARAEAEQTGHRPSSWSATMNLGYVFFLRGDLERASAFLHEALDGFAHQKAVRLEANVRVRLARVLAAQGRLADAEGEARRAVELAASLAPLLAYAHGVLAQVLLASRQAAAATEHAQRAMAILGEIGMAPEGDELIRLVHAEALEATGAHDEARAALASARGVLLARADRLPDPAMRAAFLGQSAERIRTLRST